jgi:glycosyltransferase involved in cell wall biosynthesis
MPYKNKLKILELTNFSAGICGVWNRVKEESIRLAKKGYEVKIFSSNAVKGSNDIASNKDKIGKIQIERFPFKKLGGESFMSWDFEKYALNYNPDIIIAHCYRHLHTTKALKIAKKLEEKGKKCKVFLVTHAPFDRSSTRSFFSKTIVWLYDLLIGRRIINRFTKVITITHWEEPFLLRLGLNKNNMKYIPNGIPKEFFKIKKSKEKNKIIFLGRISPIKDIETLISSIPLVKDKSTILELVGPYEKEYFRNLTKLINRLNLKKRVVFPGPVFDIIKKIKMLDSARIFVLPSKSEGMPQALVEAMSRGKIVIASDNKAAKDLVINGKNGYLFKIGNSKELAEKINFALQNKKFKIPQNAAKFAKRFSWSKILSLIESLF